MIKHLAIFKHTVEVGKAVSMSLGLGYLFASDLQVKLQGYDVFIPIWLIIVIGIVATFFIGYIMIKSKIYGEELAYSLGLNSEWNRKTTESEECVYRSKGYSTSADKR